MNTSENVKAETKSKRKKKLVDKANFKKNRFTHLAKYAGTHASHSAPED